MSVFVTTSRLALAVVAATAVSACSGESPVAPTSAVVGTGAEHNARPGHGVPGTYELTFTTYRINTLTEVSSLVVSSEELTLKAYVTDSTGQPATVGSVTFEYCSYRGGPANDISRPDEAPLEACAEGTGSWARLASMSVTEQRCARLGIGYACYNFGIVRIPRAVGFRMRYDPRGSEIAGGGTLPKNFVWVAAS